MLPVLFTRLQPVLYVIDLPSEVTFYQQLGFTVTHEETDFAALAYGDTILFGLAQRQSFRPEQAGRALLWQIGTTSVNAVFELSRRARLAVVQEPVQEPWGEWTVRLRTPNGYTVTFEGPETAY